MAEDKKYDVMGTESGDYKTMLNRSFLARKKWQPVDPKLIRSFMPGTVIEYNVKVGDKVKKGDKIIVFKAMKMNNMILAPVDGVVKSLNTTIGENVPKDTILLELK